MSIPILPEEGFRERVYIQIFGVKIFKTHHNFQIILNLLKNIGNNCCIDTCKENGTLQQIIDLIKGDDIDYIIVDPITNIFNYDNSSNSSNIDNSSNSDNIIANNYDNTVTKKRRKSQTTILGEQIANLREEIVILQGKNAKFEELIKQLIKFVFLNVSNASNDSNASNLLGYLLTKNSEHVDNQKKRLRSDSLDLDSLNSEIQQDDSLDPDSLTSEIQQDDSLDSTVGIPDSLNFEL